jgi:diaminopimelate epimerase
MPLEFYKYHGAGNDFIMIDSRQTDETIFNQKLVEQLCDRHLGIGADGLILLLSDKSADFRMKYFNSDGYEGSMCGNGGRCIAAFARDLGMIKDKTSFSGIDGLHDAVFTGNDSVKLKMIDVATVDELHDGFLINTGSPHFVTFRENTDEIDVYSQGKEIRHQSRFDTSGANVNFVQTISKNSFKIRTFERGVENETLACGTGSVASAISSYLKEKPDNCSYTIHAPGGILFVRFTPLTNGGFADVWLEGPVKFVFKGELLF